MAEKYDPVKVSISFWANPDHKTLNTEELGQGNFQWVEYGILFKKKGEEEYYAYNAHLSSDGLIQEPEMVVVSDSEGVLYKDKDIDIIPEDVHRFLPKLFKTGDRPDLTPGHKAPTIYRNTYKSDLGNTYSSEKFKQIFDKDFYVVVSKKGQMKNPFGKMVGKKGVPAEETEKQGRTMYASIAGEPLPDTRCPVCGCDKSKIASKWSSVYYGMICSNGHQWAMDDSVFRYRQIVRMAKERSLSEPFSGGFDIMKKFQESQTGHKSDTGYSGGFNILQRWQKGQPSSESDGFDAMQVRFKPHFKG